MKLIHELHFLIEAIKKESLDGLNFAERIERLKPHSRRYIELINEWINICHLGEEVPFDEIKRIIDAEIEKTRVSFIVRPNPKLPNEYDLLLGWKKKLNYLKYEIEKKTYLGEDTNCYCALRGSNSMEPDFTTLSDYGRAVLYYEDDNYVIKECNYCKTKWINDNSPGSSRGWHRWNPKEFLIREVFKNK